MLQPTPSSASSMSRRATPLAAAVASAQGGVQGLGVMPWPGGVGYRGSGSGGSSASHSSYCSTDYSGSDDEVEAAAAAAAAAAAGGAQLLAWQVQQRIGAQAAGVCVCVLCGWLGMPPVVKPWRGTAVLSLT